jgi:hypothetical protein
MRFHFGFFCRFGGLTAKQARRLETGQKLDPYVGDAMTMPGASQILRVVMPNGGQAP